MDLAWSFSKAEKEEAKAWICQATQKISIESFEKSEKYSYDFCSDRPVLNPESRFCWGEPKKEILFGGQNRESTLSTLESLSLHRGEEIPDIPDIQTNISSED